MSLFRVMFLGLIAMLATQTFAFASSNNVTPSNVGGQRDAKGCLIGAGETYSNIRKSCVRVFEVGIRLNPKINQDSAVLSAFIVFAGEEGEGNVEVFLPSRKTSFMMRQIKGENAGLWKSKSLSLNYWKGMYSLDNAGGKTIYQGPNE